MRTKVEVGVNPYLQQGRRMFAEGEFFGAALDIQPPELKKMAELCDVAFLAHEKKLFASEGASGGERWNPLSEQYRRWKKRHYPGRKILSLTGKLRKSLTQMEKTNPDHIGYGAFEPLPTINLGTSDKKAAWHYEGNAHLPKRDPIQHKTSDEQRYLDLLSGYMIDVKLKRVARQLARGSAFMARRAK